MFLNFFLYNWILLICLAAGLVCSLVLLLLGLGILFLSYFLFRLIYCLFGRLCFWSNISVLLTLLTFTFFLRWGRRRLLVIFNGCFDLNFNIFKHSLEDFSLFNEWFFGHKKLQCLWIVDTEHVWCGEWISKYLKRFVLIASLLIIGIPNDSDELYQLEISLVLHTIWQKRYN